MKKKLIISAVGAALAVGMGVAQADVKVSGYGNLSFDMIKGCCTEAGNDNKNQMNVSSNSSYLKFDASEDLGGGLTAVVSITEFLRIDNQASGAQVSGGNSYGGLATPGGVIVMGAHDTGAKLNGRAFDLFGNQLGDSRNMDVADNRVPNLIAYLSPNFSGVSFLAAYVTNTGAALGSAGTIKTSSDALTVGTFGQIITAGTGAATIDSLKAMSMMVNYTGGPLVVGVGYDKATLPSYLKDIGAKAPAWLNVGVKYTLPSATSILGFYQKHDNPLAYVLFGDKKYTTMGLGVSQALGNSTVKGQAYQLKMDYEGAAECKVTSFALGFDHAFSKTTTGYVDYAQVANKDTGDCTTALTMAAGGHGDNPGSAWGKKMSGLGVGMAIKF
jgi:predicted porin